MIVAQKAQAAIQLGITVAEFTADQAASELGFGPAETAAP